MKPSIRLIDKVIALKRCCQGKEDFLRASLGLSVSDYHCLSVFPHEETIVGNDLAGRLGLSASRMSRVAEGLVQKGFIQRNQDLNDRRLQHYSLTKEGLEIRAKIQVFLDDCEAELLKRLSKKAAKEVECGMDALIGALSE